MCVYRLNPTPSKIENTELPITMPHEQSFLFGLRKATPYTTIIYELQSPYATQEILSLRHQQ